MIWKSSPARICARNQLLASHLRMLQIVSWKYLWTACQLVLETGKASCFSCVDEGSKEVVFMGTVAD